MTRPAVHDAAVYGSAALDATRRDTAIGGVLTR